MRPEWERAPMALNRANAPRAPRPWDARGTIAHRLLNDHQRAHVGSAVAPLARRGHFGSATFDLAETLGNWRTSG
jgi:hypothetical protein